MGIRAIASASFAAIGLLAATNAHGLRYVNAVTGSDSGNACASASAPCKTITHAMTQVTPGTSTITDTIILLPGIYSLASGESFPITIRYGVKLTASDNSHRAVIDATGANARVLVMGESFNLGLTEVEALVIRGGRDVAPAGTAATGGAILVAGGLANIRRNLFEDNQAIGGRGAAFGDPGGFALGGAIGGPLCRNICGPNVINNVFVGNVAIGGAGASSPWGVGGTGGTAYGGAVYVPSGTILNNTFFANQAIGGAGGFGLLTGSGGNGYGGAAYVGGAIVNNVFARNQVVGGTGTPDGGVSWPAVLLAGSSSYIGNLFWRNTYDLFDELGMHSITADPIFHHEPDNLRIGLTSPGASSGEPLSQVVDDFDGVTRVVYSRGAFVASGYDAIHTDLDGDGRSDLLWRNTATGDVYRMLMNGFAITSGAPLYAEPNLDWKIVADADFTGDGITDLLWRNSSTGHVFLMPLDAAGNAAGGWIVFVEPDPNWKIVHAPDLDGNGQADILWWNAVTGQVYAMLLQGTTVMAQGVVYVEPDTAWRVVATGDFSGGGKQNQLIWRHQASGLVFFMSVGFADGHLSADGSMAYAEPSPAWKIVGAVDLDADQRTDLVWRNDATGEVYLMFMNGATIAGGSPFYREPNLAWKIVSAGDYNGDGYGDLLWWNESTGQAFVMLMNGSGIVAGAPVYSEPDTRWRLLGLHEYSQ